jgi:hypothetical protein
MEPAKRTSIITGIITLSALSSLLFISGVNNHVLDLIPHGIYLPFYVIFEISLLVSRIGGIFFPLPYVFLTGAVLSAFYLVLLTRKVPSSLFYCGIGVLFFLFLIVVGQNVFVRIIFLPRATSIKAVLSSLRTIFDFSVALIILYILLESVNPKALRDNLFKRGSKE